MPRIQRHSPRHTLINSTGNFSSACTVCSDSTCASAICTDKKSRKIQLRWCCRFIHLSNGFYAHACRFESRLSKQQQRQRYCLQIHASLDVEPEMLEMRLYDCGICSIHAHTHAHEFHRWSLTRGVRLATRLHPTNRRPSVLRCLRVCQCTTHCSHHPNQSEHSQRSIRHRTIAHAFLNGNVAHQPAPHTHIRANVRVRLCVCACLRVGWRAL